MAGDGVAGRLLETVDRVLELAVGERLDLPAAVTDQMVMVAAAGVDGFVAGDSRAEVDPLDEALGGEEIEDAVDARDPDPAVRAAEPVEDLLRGQAAVLTAEELDHRPAGTAVPETFALQRLQGRCRPIPPRPSPAIATMIAVLMNRLEPRPASGEMMQGHPI